MTKSRTYQKGFTLLELSFVIIIVGIIMIPLFKYYDLYLLKQRGDVTRQNLLIANEQISFYYTNTSRLPCPAQPGLPKTDPNYGMEFNATCDPAAIGLTLNSCNSNGLCLVAGARQINGVTAPIIIGSFPSNSVRDINSSSGASSFSNQAAVDGWNRQLTYAVTLSLAKDGTFKFYNGTIDAQDEFGNSTAGINKDGQYALISHGRDGNGAYTENGALFKACGTSATSRDYNNCNLDSVFVQGLGEYSGTGATFFDDYVYFGKSQNSNLWTNIVNAAVTPAVVTNDIYNLNSGNVGIKKSTPTEKLEVGGTIVVNNNALANNICDASGTNCFNPDLIAGAGKRCSSAFQVMQGLNATGNSSAVKCTTPVFSTLTQITCPLGTYVQGFRSNGTTICSAP